VLALARVNSAVGHLSMSRKKNILLVVAVLLVALLFVPFPVVVARACTIQVVDANGKPLPNLKVGRGWAYGSPETLEEGHTGPDGSATFDPRSERHSLFGRVFANVANVVAVHGSAHIYDEYVVSFPDGFTAAIDGEASFKWVYEEGHLAKIDLSDMPRDKQYRIKFTFKKKTP
jgi:hypothetical protein